MLFHRYPAVEFVQKQSNDDTHSDADDVDHRRSRLRESGNRDDHDGGCHHDTDDAVESERVKMIKQCVDGFRQADHRHQRADSARDQDAEIKMSDAVHKGGVESQRHQQGGKAHARSDDAQRQAESAEQVPEKVGGNLHGSELQPEQDQENGTHTYQQRDPGSGAASLFSGFPEQRGQHAHDQADKQADGGIRILLQKEGQQVCHSQETDDAADEHRNQLRNVGFKIGKGIRQQLHDGLVNAENHAENASGDSGKHSAQSNQCPLQDTVYELQRRGFAFLILTHKFLNPFFVQCNSP